jgi:hypothetical protein
MALKFVKTPVKKKRVAKRGLLAAARTPAKRVVIQEYAAIDQFGELPARKKAAAQIARGLGHDLMPWHKRTNDPAGRWNAYCMDCNRAAVVCTEAPLGFSESYGPALTEVCKKGS